MPEDQPDGEDSMLHEDALKPDEVSVDWYPHGRNSVVHEEKVSVGFYGGGGS